VCFKQSKRALNIDSNGHQKKRKNNKHKNVSKQQEKRYKTRFYISPNCRHKLSVVRLSVAVYMSGSAGVQEEASSAAGEDARRLSENVDG